MKVAAWNVRTLLDPKSNSDSDRPRRRTALIASELGRYNIDIAALSETRLHGEDSLHEVGAGYTFFWKGLPEDSPRIHGVGFAIKSALLRQCPESPVGVSERLMTLRIPLADKRYATIISAYAPTLPSPDDVKAAFYDTLTRCISSIPRADKIILLGDFNARVGSNHVVWGGIIGRHGVGNTNENGVRLLNLCAEHDLIITNTMFQLPDKLKTSWMHPRSKHWHLIDYVITRKQDRQDVVITRALRGADCWTDHRLIRSIMRLRVRPPVRKRPSAKHINRAPFADPQCRSVLRGALATALEAVPVNSDDTSRDAITAEWDSISSALLDTTTSVFGVSRRKHQDWFDENALQIRELLNQKNNAHKAAIDNPSCPVLRERFSRLRSTVQAALRRMENEWWLLKAAEIQGFADAHNSHQFYDAIKTIYGPTRSCNVPLRSSDGSTLIKDTKGILDRWVEHLSELLNRINPFDNTFIDSLPTLPPIPDLDITPSFPEVLKACRGLKNNKACGPDALPGEIFKYGGYCVTRRLHRFIGKVWLSETLPQQWKDANIVTVYKRKGDKATCGNYRGISLLAVAGKVLARVLLARLLDSVADVIMPESQCGFRKDRSTTDMIFAARLLQEKCREQHQDLFVAFVDLTKAFDTVNRDLLWIILSKCGCPPKFTAILREFHQGMSARAVAGGLVSEPFAVNVGVKQGCVLAPVIFNIYLAAVTLLSRHRLHQADGVSIRYRLDGSLFNLRRLQARTKTSTTTIFDLQYADDAAFPSLSAPGLHRTLSTMDATYSSAGLVINAKKTEVLCQPSPGAPPSDQNFLVGEEPIAKVDNFTYLGSILSSSCSLSDEIHNRIRQATTAFGRLSDRVFLNRNLSLSTKVAVYSAVCLSILLYGGEVWTLYRVDVRSLEAFHIRCLQRILGITWKDRVPHAQILQRTNQRCIEALVVQRQLRYIGHVIRMPENRLPRQILYSELASGRRSQGGQKKRFKDHLQSVLKKCSIQQSRLETLAASRVQWRTTCRIAVDHLDRDHIRACEERRQRRHERQARQPLAPGEGVPCPTGGRRCASDFGLRSHLRSHNRRNNTS